MATLSDYQISISVDIDSSATAPSSSDPEFDRRTVLLNRALVKWARTRDYRWSSLYTPYSVNSVAGQSYVSLPSDFRWGNAVLSETGAVVINGLNYEMISPDQRHNRVSSDNYVYITGNKQTGFRLNINPTPDAVFSIPLDYYTIYLVIDEDGVTHKEKLVNGGDFSKCPDDIYPPLETLAQLYKDDDEGNKGIDFERQAVDILNTMLAQENGGQENQSMEIQSQWEESGFPAIGK